MDERTVVQSLEKRIENIERLVFGESEKDADYPKVCFFSVCSIILFHYSHRFGLHSQMISNSSSMGRGTHFFVHGAVDKNTSTKIFRSHKTSVQIHLQTSVVCVYGLRPI